MLFGLVADRSPARSIGVAAGAVQGYFGGWVDLALPALHRDLVGAARALPADHPGQHGGAQRSGGSSGSCCSSAGWRWWRRARRVPARAELRLRARGARARRRETLEIMRRHVLPNAMVATLTFLPFILNGVHHHAHLARLPRLRAAARLRLARRAPGPGQGQPPGALARAHRLPRARRDADAPHLHRRGRARRLRPAEEPREPAAQAADPRVVTRDPRSAPRGPRSRRVLRRRRAARCARSTRLVRHRPRGDARARRRERLRQIGDRALDPPAPALPARPPPAREHPLPRPRSCWARRSDACARSAATASR